MNRRDCFLWFLCTVTVGCFQWLFILVPVLTAMRGMDGESSNSSDNDSSSEMDGVYVVNENVAENEVIVLEIGMKFENVEDMFQCFKNYTKYKGFATRKQRSKKNEDGILRSVTFACCRGGKLRSTKSVGLLTHPTNETGCKVMPYPSGAYGSFNHPSGPYGMMPHPSGAYGSFNHLSGPYGMMPHPSRAYGVMPQPSGPYGVMPQPSGPYGVMPQPSGPYGMMPQPSMSSLGSIE